MTKAPFRLTPEGGLSRFATIPKPEAPRLLSHVRLYQTTS